MADYKKRGNIVARQTSFFVVLNKDFGIIGVELECRLRSQAFNVGNVRD
jgi:hypothetical protein